MIDESCLGCAPGPSSKLRDLVRFVLTAFRRRDNRRRILRLQDMSDQDLKDIGLTRLDLRLAIHESGFFGDPSIGLMQRARRSIER
nr:DUF1127 domain-containing protein [uncultured Gellertiella sp.]